MRTLAIIPARGGSKRVPGKNTLAVGTRLLVEHAVLSAAPCDMVVVSTDDPVVVEVCTTAATSDRTRATIHHRLPEHATDDAQLEPVIDDVLASIDRVGAETHGIGIDAIVLLQPTSPFRTAAHVAEALRVLRETGCDSVVSVTRLHSLHQGFHGTVWDESGRYTPVLACQWRPSSAELSALVYENGAVYAFTRRHWNATRNRMGGDMRALVMHWSEAVEIDTPEDLEAARRLAR